MSAPHWNKLRKNARSQGSVSNGESWWVDAAVTTFYLLCCLCVSVISSWNNILFSYCVSDLTCPKGLVYDECRFKLDDFCYRGFVECIWLWLSVKGKKERTLRVLTFFNLCTEHWFLEPPWSTRALVVFVPVANSGLEITQTSVFLNVTVSKMHIEQNKCIRNTE